MGVRRHRRAMVLPCVFLFAVAGRAQDADALFHAGGGRLEQGKWQEAVDLFQQAKRLFEADSRTPPEQLAAVWQALATSYRGRRQYSAAEAAYRKALAGCGESRRVEILVSMAAVYQDTGRYAQAMSALTSATEIVQASPAPEPGLRAFLLNNKAVLARRLGRNADAVSALLEARSLLDGAGHANSLLMVHILDNLASTRASEKNFVEASNLCLSALALAPAAHAPPASLVAMMRACATSLRRSGNKQLANPLLARAKELELTLPREPAEGAVIDVTVLGAGH